MTPQAHPRDAALTSGGWLLDVAAVLLLAAAIGAGAARCPGWLASVDCTSAGDLPSS